MIAPRRFIGLPLYLTVLAACGEPRTTPGAKTASPGTSSAADTLAPAGGAARLDSAARRLVAFLQGQRTLDSVWLADTVVLRLAPEGGGHETRMPRAALREPAAWAVPAGRARYAIAPAAGLSQLTTAAGRHFNCQPSTLTERAPAWASAPHVGARLAPAGGVDSCLRTWNATFVFDTIPSGRSPRLVGVLYDQWEW